jgi:hypothetical protein
VAALLNNSTCGSRRVQSDIFSPSGNHVPYKHSEARRHKFKKTQYKVTNWPEYNAALKRRRDFTMWFTENAIAGWCPTKTGARGRPMKYSDVAIETVLFIRQVFHLALRQTEGFMNSLARALKVEIRIPISAVFRSEAPVCQDMP